MDTPRRLGTGALVSLCLGAATGAALGAAKAVAVRDRKRQGTTRPEVERAERDLLDEHGVTRIVVRADDGAVLNVREFGRSGASDPSKVAPTVVLLHGVTLDGRIWLPLCRLFPDCRVLMPDWRGHGASSTGSAGYGLPVIAADLLAILRHLDVHDAIVVGHSMGGMALLRCWADHRSELRSRVGGVCLLSTAASDVGRGSLPEVASGVIQGLLSKTGLGRLARWTAPGDIGYSMVRMTFGQRPNPAWVEAARTVVSSMDPAACSASFVPLLAHDARSALPTIDVPVTVVVGSHDRLTPPAQARAMAAPIPDVRLVELQGPGHMVMFEQTDTLAGELRALMKRVQDHPRSSAQ